MGARVNTMPIQIGHRPDHDFTEPLGLLSDCHRRIEHFLGVLIAIDDDAAGGALSEDYRSGLETAIRYFKIAAPKHTADEEVSLFPRLRNSGDAVAMEALRVLEQLEADHNAAETHHAAVERLVHRWLADDGLNATARTELHDHLRQLQNLYQQHIAIEDHSLFPAAELILTREQIHQVGREMAARRGVRLDGAEAHQSE